MSNESVSIHRMAFTHKSWGRKPSFGQELTLKGWGYRSVIEHLPCIHNAFDTVASTAGERAHIDPAVH